MKIGEWDNLGRARELLQRQLGDLGAAEYAAHVTLNQENGRMRIYIATDIGLLEYKYAPAGADPEGAWMLRGQLYRWSGVRGLRLQNEAQIDDDWRRSRGLAPGGRGSEARPRGRLRGRRACDRPDAGLRTGLPPARRVKLSG